MTKATKILSGFLVAAIISLIVVAAHAESKYDTGTTAAEVTFAPKTGGTTLDAIMAKSNKDDSYIKIYARSGNRRAPSSSPALGATVVSVVNTGLALTTNDHVVYVHNDGTLLKSTVTNATTTAIGMADALTVAGEAGDYIYELAQDFQVTLGTTALNLTGGELYRSPSDSPLYIIVDGTGSCAVAVTASP